MKKQEIESVRIMKDVRTVRYLKEAEFQKNFNDSIKSSLNGIDSDKYIRVDFKNRDFAVYFPSSDGKVFIIFNRLKNGIFKTEKKRIKLV